MKKLLALLPVLSTLACAQNAEGSDTLRTVILIALGAASVVLLILFGRPKKTSGSENERKPEP